MEFSSGPVPTPLPQYRYQSKAIITLHPPHSEDNPELQRTSSRGSIGRRLSFGSNKDKDRDSDEPHEERGGGLRSFARRLSMDPQNKDRDQAGPGLTRTKSKDLKQNLTGKWATNVEIAVTPNHLILILSPDHPLAPFPPPPGAPGYTPQGRRGSHSTPAGTTGTTTGNNTTGGATTTAGGTEENQPGGIGQKIKNIFTHRKSTDQGAGTTKPTTGTTSATHDSAFVEETTPAAPVAPVAPGSTAVTQEPELAPATTPAQATPSFPAYVSGRPTTHVLVPIAAIKEKECSIVDSKGEIALRVPITSHFSSFVHPMLEGKEHDESWGRSGKIKFQFDRNWLGAKGEAEVLLHNILLAIENRRSNPTAGGQTLDLGQTHQGQGQGQTALAGQHSGVGGGGGTTAASQGIIGTGGSAGQTQGHTNLTQDVDPLDTSSEAKVAGVPN